jgi:predicted short-subunit dehydrogenase-like oxidoreductase (DUF2520 family)
MKIAMVGAGVIGTALGLLLQRAGHVVVALAGRTKRRTQAAAERLGGVEVVTDPGLAAMGADVVLLAVPDREIAGVAQRIAAAGALRRGAVVAHLAGGLGTTVLEPVRAVGAHVGTLHPLQTFADVETALQLLPGTYCAVEGDALAAEALTRLAHDLGGRPFHVAPGHKASYHAGAVVASNFVVTLMDVAVELLQRAGIPRDEALPALLPLLRGTLANLEKVGLPDALTGPVARGDTGTVRGHLAALATGPDALRHLYVTLSRRTLELALRKGSLRPAQAEPLRALLAEHDPGAEPSAGNPAPGP